MALNYKSVCGISEVLIRGLGRGRTAAGWGVGEATNRLQFFFCTGRRVSSFGTSVVRSFFGLRATDGVPIPAGAGAATAATEWENALAIGKV